MSPVKRSDYIGPFFYPSGDFLCAKHGCKIAVFSLRYYCFVFQVAIEIIAILCYAIIN